MIHAVTSETLPLAENILAQDDCVGMRIVSTVSCYGFSSKLCRLYLVDNAAVLMVLGDAALLCGAATDIAELESFLQFAGVKKFQSNRTVLYSWRIVQQLQMQFVGPLPEQGAEISRAPNLYKLAHALFAQDGKTDPDAYYADACLRTNHGQADIRAIVADGKYVSTAGIYAKENNSVYITAVATHPNYQNRGYASALVASLCRAYAGKKIYLYCRPALRKFYEKLGFALVTPVCEFEKPE